MRRRLLLLLAVLAVIGVAYAAWLGWQVQRELTAAQASVTRLQAAVNDGDVAARDRAAADLQEAARGARDATDGPAWSVVAHLPLLGDDATGLRALSRSLDIVATDAARPLLDTVDRLDEVVSDGRIDPAVVQALGSPVSKAHTAVASASAQVSSLDSSGYAGALKSRFRTYVGQVSDLANGLSSAEKATTVLPGMLGAERPRDYLLVFQNNAEIRATGGLPGSWALVHAEDGRLSLVEQGTAGAFPHAGPARASASASRSERSTTRLWAPTSRTPASPRTSRARPS